MLRVYIGTYNFAFTEIPDKEIRRIPFLSASDIHSHDFFFLFPLSFPPLSGPFISGRRRDMDHACIKRGKKKKKKKRGGE